MKQQLRKQLEVLYAWAWYYNHYRMFTDLNNIQIEIRELQSHLKSTQNEKTAEIVRGTQ